MFLSSVLLAALIAASPSVASPVVDARATCKNYVIISTRGTSELQGKSIAFTQCISSTLASIPGGVEADTVYPAGYDQNSASGTQDILNRIRNGRASCPQQKFVLMGYSQGAAATVNALKTLSPTSGDGAAVAAVFLVGDPEHLPGKQSNRDQSGGSSTNSAVGLEAYLPGSGIPAAWDTSSRVLDVCYAGDGVCAGYGITTPHLLYGSTPSVQSQCTSLLASNLR